MSERESLFDDAPEVSQSRVWYVVNHDNDDRPVRGPYQTSEAAAAVRRELERLEQFGEVNLWLVSCP